MPSKLPVKKDFSAGGVVWDAKKKKVLMIYVQNLSGDKVWTFPKGHPEQGESPKEAALREVREETGWDCIVQDLLLDVHYSYVHKKVRLQKTVQWFAMRPVEKVGEFMQDEVLDCQWMSYDEARKAVSYKSDIEILLYLKRKQDDGTL